MNKKPSCSEHNIPLTSVKHFYSNEDQEIADDISICPLCLDMTDFVGIITQGKTAEERSKIIDDAYADFEKWKESDNIINLLNPK